MASRSPSTATSSRTATTTNSPARCQSFFNPDPHRFCVRPRGPAPRTHTPCVRLTLCQVAAALPLTAVPASAAVVLDALRSVESTAEPQNSALFNFYDGGSDYMGAHSDDERQLHRGTPIVSLSWCHPRTHHRRFRLLPKDGVRDACVPLAWRVGSLKGALVMLGDGDLIVMGGACQTTHKHEVMPARSKVLSEQHGRRINLTVRSFADASAAVAPAEVAPAEVAPAEVAPAEMAATAAWGSDAEVRVETGASTAADAATSDAALERGWGEDRAGGVGFDGRDGPTEGKQWACSACTFLNSALLPCCEVCDASRATNLPPSPQVDAAALASRRGGTTDNPRKRAGPSTGKETKQVKQADRTNPSIRTCFSRCSDNAALIKQSYSLGGLSVHVVFEIHWVRVNERMRFTSCHMTGPVPHCPR